jgi:hypothetical protein
VFRLPEDRKNRLNKFSRRDRFFSRFGDQSVTKNAAIHHKNSAMWTDEIIIAKSTENTMPERGHGREK